MTSRSLFRQEALQFRQSEQSGELGFRQPLTIRLSVLVILLITISVALWLFTATFHNSEKIRGYLAPAAGIDRITAPISGEIERLLVKEQQLVKPGTPLVQLVHRQNTAVNTDQMQVYRQTLTEQKDSLEAELIALGQTSRHQQLDGHQILSEQRSVLNMFQQRRPLHLRMVGNTEARLSSLSLMHEQGYVSRHAMLAAEQELLIARQSLSDLDATIARQKISVASAQRDLDNLAPEITARQQALKRQIAGKRQQLAAQFASQRRIVLAPRSARVTAIEQRAGARVQANQPLLTLVPTDSRLQAHLILPDNAAGFIKPGQTVKLAVDAYPHEKFGLFTATITQVSSAAYIPDNSPFPTPFPVFVAKAELDTNFLLVKGQRVDLRTHQQFSADIQLEQRTLIEWLLAPLIAARSWHK